VTFEYWYVGPELPLVVLLFVLMLLAREGGYRIARARAQRNPDAIRPQVNVVVAATLALLALLVGFSLTMAVERYDARRQLVLAEANVIATMHLRARLLPAPAGPALLDWLRQYVDLRLDVTGDAHDLARRSETLQGEMLAIVATLARQEPRSVPVDRLIDALKELIDAHERRLSAFESFVPEAVLYLLALAAIGAALLAGYGSGLASHRNRLATTVYTTLICLVILVIVDLDRPARGLIRLSQRSLQRQREQLASAPAAAPADPFAAVRPVRYRCDDGRDVLASFTRVDPPMARIERDGARWLLPLRPSGSGAQYSDGSVTFWEHHGEARLEREGRAVTCRPVPSS
jgi:membrane-bound inhibitor of C-type lysozyme